jgi:hypothetical protein
MYGSVRHLDCILHTQDISCFMKGNPTKDHLRIVIIQNASGRYQLVQPSLRLKTSVINLPNAKKLDLRNPYGRNIHRQYSLLTLTPTKSGLITKEAIRMGRYNMVSLNCLSLRHCGCRKFTENDSIVDRGLNLVSVVGKLKV